MTLPFCSSLLLERVAATLSSLHSSSFHDSRDRITRRGALRHLHFGELSHSTGQGEGIVLTASESEERGREGERGGCLNKISDRRIDDIAQEMQQTIIATATGDDENCRGRLSPTGGCRVGGDNESKAAPVFLSPPLPLLS